MVLLQVGFQKDSKWMYSGSEDGTVKIWDMRAPGFQREYASRGAVNTVVLHPNQGELVSGDRHATLFQPTSKSPRLSRLAYGSARSQLLKHMYKTSTLMVNYALLGLSQSDLSQLGC